MTVLVIDGSRRPKSNTGAIARDLAGPARPRPERPRVWRVPKWSAGRRRRARRWRGWPRRDVVVLVAPSYLDELPAVTQRLLEDVWERRAELGGHAPLFYGIAHSGFPEPIQRRAELRSMRFFAEQMGWRWMGGVGFGGTSPIDGRPLDEAGMFSKQLRKVLPLAAADIAAGRAVLARDRPSLREVPVPACRVRMMIALVNSRTRKTARDKQLELDTKVYAERGQE